jgi:Tfp pilus assembly PilM family ATPase
MKAVNASAGPVQVGIAISIEGLEGTLFSPKDHAITKSVFLPLPQATLSSSGDEVDDPVALGNAIQSVLKELGAKTKNIHVSVPVTLLRLLELPKMETTELLVSLSSEAERFKSFDNTEASVDFEHIASLPNTPNNTQRILFGAIRQDTLKGYTKALQIARVKALTIDFEPLNVLRGMGGTGVLDSLAQQIGAEAKWGVLFVEPERIRLTIWQGNNLIDLREVNMDTRSLQDVSSRSSVLDEIVEELDRSAKRFEPIIWLTHKLSDICNQDVASRLGVPVRSCLISPAFPVDRPSISVAAVGIAMRQQVDFPFNLNLTQAGKNNTTTKTKEKNEKKAKIAAPRIKSDEENQSMQLAMRLGLASCVLVGLVGGVFSFMNNSVTTKVKEQESKKVALEQNITLLTAQVDDLKRKASVYENLTTLSRSARLRNKVCLNLAEDLQRKTPTNVWVSSIDLTSGFQLEGKSLDHRAVMDFARSFDSTRYTSSVLINSIKEGFVGTTPVFDFKIGGQVNLANMETPEQSDTLEKTVSQGVAEPQMTKNPPQNG